MMHSLTFMNIALFLLSFFTLSHTLPIPSPESASPHIPGGPVIPQEFADPSFIRLNDGNYYAFATTDSPDTAVQVAKASNFNNPSWTVLQTEVLPDPGAWTDHSANVWAPYAVELPSGSFGLYYSAPPASDPSKHCIGYATSDSITGPYKPSPTPWACPLSAGGAIDAAFFKDPQSGNSYVVYKIDGNSLNVPNGPLHPTPIMLQQVDSSDSVTPVGNPVQLLDRSSSDGPLVEAPTIIFENGVYFLLISSNMYNTNAYNIKYASSSGIAGPYSAPQVLLQTGDGHGVVAPGSGDIHDGRMVFHGTVAAGPVRNMYAGNVKVEGTTLTFQGCL